MAQWTTEHSSLRRKYGQYIQFILFDQSDVLDMYASAYHISNAMTLERAEYWRKAILLKLQKTNIDPETDLTPLGKKLLDLQSHLNEIK